MWFYLPSIMIKTRYLLSTLLTSANIDKIKISPGELKLIKRMFKKVIFRRKLVEIISHFHWFLLENVIFSMDPASLKKANLEIIKIRKEWEGDVKFTVPYEIRSMYIREVRNYMKLEHNHKVREVKRKALEFQEDEYVRRASTVKALLGKHEVEVVEDALERKQLFIH